MQDSRDVSKLVDRLLFESYSRGILVPHPQYWSWPDSESVLTSINDLQEHDRLREFFGEFFKKPYELNRQEVFIKDIKFSFPHIRSSHDTPPPDPTMSDDEIRKYIWPNGELSRGSVGSYVSALWADVGQEDVTFTDEGDDIFGLVPTRESNWRKLMDWPMMVGSNHCNLAMMRSYLDSDEPLPIPDSHGNATMGERARYLLDEVIKYEPHAPDGYFVVNGKMKRVNIIDRIQMNMIYVIKDSRKMPLPLADTNRTSVIDDRICEVRSVMQDQGLVFHQLYFMYTSLDTIPKGIDREVYKRYNAPAIMSISSLRMAMNIFDVIRGYALIAQGTDGAQGMSDLMSEIEAMTGSDPDIMRAAYVSREHAEVNDDTYIRGLFTDLLMAKRDTRIDDADIMMADLKRVIEARVLPHCSLGTDDPYTARIRFMAMMFTKLTYTVMGTMPDSDRKDFSFKRWEPVGYLLRDYLRNFFLYQKNLDRSSRGEQNLLVLMNQNKWPTRYTLGVRSLNKNAYKDGVVDDVVKFNTISMIDSIRTIKISAKSSVNTAATRKIHTSQWGAQCFANTPENANIGLNNNLAEAVLISAELTHDERDSLHAIIEQEEEVPTDEGYLLMVDGCPWKVVDPSFYDVLRGHRQEGTINRGIGLAMHDMWATDVWPGVPVIVVLTSHGRPIIPLLRLDRDPIAMDRLLEIPNLESPTLEGLIEDGLVEMVDSYELSYNVVVAEWLYIRDRDGEFKEIDPSLYTHCMIKPGYILSQATNTLSFLEHNPAARGTYATVHTKQSISRPFIHPEERYDHEINYLRNPELPLVTTDTTRRLDKVGIGRNVRIACMPYDNNRDDAIVFSERVVKDGILDGVHYNVFKSDHGITGQNRYNWQIQDLGGELSEIRGLVDPDFSDSVILPYGKPHMIERPQSEVQELQQIPLRRYGQHVYQVEDGRLYTVWGTYKPVTITYDDGSTRTIEPGKEPYDLPGKTRVSSTTEEPIVRLALAYVREDMMKAGYIDTLATEDSNQGWKDTPFITKDPLFTSKSGSWHGPVDAPIPRTPTSVTASTVRGTLMAIYPRRAIIRTETAVKLLERGILLEADKIVNIRKERFDITYGYIDGIDRTSGIKIRGAMPIGPKPGNKYAALYAQKNVNAGIIPEDRMPVARWTNPITGKEEEMHYDIVFNPLSFPSRMTMGMIIEILVAGTLDYLYGLPYPQGGTIKDAITSDPDGVSRYIEGTYGVEDIVSLIAYLSDSTCFMYDNEEKIARTRDLREKLGIPVDGLYDVYMPDGTKVTNRIYSGTVYYVALRHLVDNKRRARGYVGKKDPMTLQPVKGRRRNGGANTGVQETDAYKAHSAAALLHERMATTSDAETLYKCPDCGGLATRLSREEYRCVDCGTVIPANQVIMHNTVWSWHLFRNYLRAISVDMREDFQ